MLKHVGSNFFAFRRAFFFRTNPLSTGDWVYPPLYGPSFLHALDLHAALWSLVKFQFRIQPIHGVILFMPCFLTLVMMGAGPYVPPPKVFLFFYQKSLPLTKPLDPVNS